MSAALLAKAAKHLESGDHARALAPLLAAWRGHPSERLGALVERVSDLAEVSRPKVPGTTTKARLAAGLALLKTGDPADVPRAFRLLADVKIAEAQVLATALAKLAPDPRFLRLLVALLVAPPWGSSTSRTLWRMLFDALVTHGDPRTAAQLAAIDFRPIIGNDWGTAEMTKLVARTIAKLVVTAPAPDASVAGACLALEDRLAAGTGEGDRLLAQIHADPADLGLRAIYADWLQEHDDPRGELIAIQLAAGGTDAQRRREAALLESHRMEWLGALAPACFDEPRFAAGFVSELRIDVARALGLAGAPAWSTVTTVWLRDHEAWPRALLRHPAMRALRFVGDATLGDIRKIVADAEPWSIAGLGLDLRDHVTKRDLAAIASLDALPLLRELGIDPAWRVQPGAVRALWSTPLGKRLERLRWRSDLRAIPAWLTEQPHLPDSLKALEISSDGGWTGWTVELARGADGRFSRLDATLRPSRDRGEPTKAIELVEAVLDEVRPDAFESLTLRLDRTRVTKSELAQIAAAAARQTRLTSLVVGGEPVAVAQLPAASLKDIRAAAEATADAAARVELAEAAAALPAATARTITALDLAAPATVAAVLAGMAGVSVGKAWIAVAYALLGLPDVKGASEPQKAVRHAAIRLLVAAKPAGAGAKICELLDRPRGPWWPLCQELGMIPAGELGTLFDWFEARRGKAVPRADQIYYAVIAAAAASKSSKVRADLKRRAKRKLTRFQAYAYREAIKLLA